MGMVQPTLTLVTAWDGTKKLIGLGVVIRDNGGVLVAALVQTVPHITDPTHAEAMAAWKAVSFCSDLGLRRATFEGDSLQVVSAMRKDEPCWTSFSQLIEDSMVLLSSLDYFDVRHTRRTSNQAAH
ncbi:uncharacterized protein LOC133863239 [Alnus glutinosa]|uniref:uncharacterized protein LOC133863239 n=1 Tax=Alnus glutinosa TaxID=3517 RepID=UPI002D79A895|nr:uncharacterized protein LOC133863239 [Alnus glutinosa]